MHVKTNSSPLEKRPRNWQERNTIFKTQSARPFQERNHNYSVEELLKETLIFMQWEDQIEAVEVLAKGNIGFVY